MKQVLGEQGDPTLKDSLITLLEEPFFDFKTDAEVALKITVTSVATKHGRQNKIKIATRCCLFEAKTQNLMITSAAVLGVFDPAKARTNFKSIQSRKKI